MLGDIMVKCSTFHSVQSLSHTHTQAHDLLVKYVNDMSELQGVVIERLCKKVAIVV